MKAFEKMISKGYPKAFNTWFNQFDNTHWIPKPVAFAGWQAALEWVLDGMDNDRENVYLDVEQELADE